MPMITVKVLQFVALKPGIARWVRLVDNPYLMLAPRRTRTCESENLQKRFNFSVTIPIAQTFRGFEQPINGLIGIG